MTWLRLKKISVIVPKRAYFRVFQPTNHLKFHDKDIAKWKKVNLEVKQSPEKPNKELEIMEDISKLLRSTPNSDNWHDGCSRDQIYPLRSKEHQILNQQIACQIPKRRCCCCCSSTNTSGSDTTSDPDVWQYKHKSTQHFVERAIAVWFT